MTLFRDGIRLSCEEAFSFPEVSDMRSLMGCLMVTVTIALSGCSSGKVSPRSPVAPSVAAPVIPAAVPVTSTSAPVPSGPPSFALTVSAFRVLLFRRSGSRIFQYEPEKLELVETSGKSSATLLTLDVDAQGGGGDRDCLNVEMVRGQIIAPGKTRDLATTMGYCMPYADTTVEVSEVSFTATFADDQGRVGEVRGSVDVTGCTLANSDGLVICK